MSVHKVVKDVLDKVDNRYRVRVPIPGKRNHYVTEVVRGNRRATDRETELKVLLRGGALTGDRTVRVGELLDDLLAAKKTLSTNTRRGYRDSIELHIKPEIGHLRVTSLVDKRLLLVGLFEGVEKHAGRGARRRVESLVRGMLNYALDEGIIERNPLRKEPWVKETRRRPYWPTASDVVAIRRQVAKQRVMTPGSIEMTTAALDVLIGSGVRAGELSGLSVNDVDNERLTISVARQVIYVPPNEDLWPGWPGGFVFGPPKTDDSSVRTIPVPKFVTAGLAATRLRNGVRSITLPWEDPAGPMQTHDLFFYSLPDPTKPMPPGAMTQRLSTIGKKLGLAGPVTTHGYRRRYTTILADGGVPSVVRDYVTGHLSTGSITDTVYTEISERGKEMVREVTAAWWAVAQSAAEPTSQQPGLIVGQ